MGRSNFFFFEGMVLLKFFYYYKKKNLAKNVYFSNSKIGLAVLRND